MTTPTEEPTMQEDVEQIRVGLSRLARMPCESMNGHACSCGFEVVYASFTRLVERLRELEGRRDG